MDSPFKKMHEKKKPIRKAEFNLRKPQRPSVTSHQTKGGSVAGKELTDRAFSND